MSRLRVLKPHEAPARPRSIVLSPKAQLYLEYLGQLDHLKYMGELRDMYLQARTAENINKISTAEMEDIVKNSLRLATHGKAFSDDVRDYRAGKLGTTG